MAKITKKIKKDEVSTKDEFYSEIRKKITDAEAHTAVWRTNQDKWHRLRMRIKKTKTFPFVGCSNLRMPTIEIKLRKLKSQLMKVIWAVRPVVQAIPSPSGNLQTAQKIEKFLDHLINDVIKLKKKAVIAVDQEMEKGFYLFKPYWRTEITTRIEEYSLKDLSINELRWVYSLQTTDDMLSAMIKDRLDVDMHDLVAEFNIKTIQDLVSQIRQGKSEFKFELQDVLYNFPDVSLANPEFVFVPADTGAEPQEARMIVHEFYLPYNTVKRNIEFKNWSSSAINEIEYLKALDLKNLTETTKDMREGIERINNPSEQVKIWECYMWYDINNDGYEEKCVFTLAPEFHKVLRKITLPYDNAKWPFIQLAYELTDDRWFSHRGIPELIEDIVKEIDTQHNQKIDGQTFRNVPMFTYRAGVVNPNLVKFIPGQAIPRQDKDDITLQQNTNLNAEFSYEREQMLLESKVEELIGQVDFTLQSMINRRQPRTRGEVELQFQSQQLVFSLDADLHTEGFSELFSYIWDLWCQYGDDEYEFAYFGQNGWEKIKLSREEIQGKYKIVVRGNDQNINPMVKFQKAQMIMNATMNPVAIQSGIIQPNNLYNAYKRFYQVMDEQNWQDFITQPQPQQPGLPPQTLPKFEDLVEGEQIQALGRMGIQPDIPGRQLEREQELAESAPEQPQPPSLGG